MLLREIWTYLIGSCHCFQQTATPSRVIVQNENLQKLQKLWFANKNSHTKLHFKPANSVWSCHASVCVQSHHPVLYKLSCTKSEAIIAVTMETTLLSNVTPWCLVKIFWRFTETCCLRPKNWGNRSLWNIGKFPPYYTVSHPRKRKS
jgi:hypothetical protein